MESFIPKYTEFISEGNLMHHAKHELHKAGLFDKDSDYDGMIGKAVMALMKTFSDQGHSGFSAPWVVSVFTKLANWDTLTPITSDPEEWNDISDMCDGEPCWQNTRCPRFFSKDGGKTWYDVDKKKVKAVQEAVAYAGVFEEYQNGKQKPRWFTLTEERFNYFYNIIYKHLPQDNQFAKDVLESIRKNKYRCSERQYNYLKSAISGYDKPEHYSPLS